MDVAEGCARPMEHFAFAMFAQDISLNGSRTHTKRIGEVHTKPQAVEAGAGAEYVDAWR